MTSKVYVRASGEGATPERAFTAFVEEIGAWWRPNMDCSRRRPRGPGVLSFEPGEGGRLIGNAGRR